MAFMTDERSAARVAGKTRYFTGMPCRQGHVCQRYTNDGGCVECKALRQRYKKSASERASISKPRADARPERKASPNHIAGVTLAQLMARR